MQFVLVQSLCIRRFGNANRLRRSRFTFRIQGKMHSVKSGEHRHRVIAPQSSVAPNNFLWHTDDPAGNVGIAGVDKLPALPVFLSSGRARLTWSVIWTVTKLFFMTIVPFAGEKSTAAHVLPKIGFEGSVLSRF